MHSTHFHDQVPSYSELLISHCVCVYIGLSVLVLALLVRAETFVFQTALVGGSGQMYTYPTTQASISIMYNSKTPFTFNKVHITSLRRCGQHGYRETLTLVTTAAMQKRRPFALLMLRFVSWVTV